jgi:hypothetical protein
VDVTNEEFQEVVLTKLIKIENKLDELTDQRNPDSLRLRPKVNWKPSYDLDAMDKYCKKNKKHPADLTGEEMAQFRIRKFPDKITHINAHQDD